MATYALVGEAWGADEEIESKRLGRPSPFVGSAGQILNSCLRAAGIDRASECLITNVFNLRPPDNKLKAIMVPKAKGIKEFPAFRPGQYLDPALFPEIERLYNELETAGPKVIVCLGGVALWALMGSSSMGSRRGHLHYWHNIPMIPTYHPARILRQYHLKRSLIGDLTKARELANGEVFPDTFSYIAEPTLKDIEDFYEEAKSFGLVAEDIETLPAYKAITCIGFGMPHRSICVPFFHEKKPGYNYWDTKEEEYKALMLCKAISEDKNIKKIFHKCNYDIPWLADILGIEIEGEVSDSIVIHGNMFAELPHSLSDLTATWLLFPPWKALHSSNKSSDASSDTEESE